ncbi:MAG TPA: hypothetical protein VH476_10570 [Solirubrobacterales bacterium]
MTIRGARLSRRPRAAVLCVCLAAVGSLFAAGSAQALQFTPHTLEGSFNGSASPGGPFSEVKSVAVDQQSGAVYVLTTQSGLKLFKFNAQGVAAAFTDPSLAGSSVLSVTGESVCGCSEPKVVVDNSGGAHQGRIYVDSGWVEKIWAFEPSGAAVGGNFPMEISAEAIAVDPETGGLLAEGIHLIDHVYEFTPDGVETGRDVKIFLGEGFSFRLEAGPHGELFTYEGHSGILKFSRSGELIDTLAKGTYTFNVDQASGDVLNAEYERASLFDSNGDELPGLTFTGSAQSVALNGGNGYIYVALYGSVDVFAPQAPVTLPDVTVEPPTNIAPTSVTLDATVNPDAVETTECVFEYGTTISYGQTMPCDQGQALSGSSATPVSATISGLNQGATYHYRLAVANANGAFRTRDKVIIPSDFPAVKEPYVTEIHSDSVVFHDEITAEGASTTFHVLYGTADCAAEPGECTSTPESSSIGGGLFPVLVTTGATGLQQGTTYHYVIFATNQSGTTESSEQTFTTFPYTPILEDPCANAHVRQQTGAALLADCRAYELVSAGNSGGYNVESYLTAGQEPFGGYPYAENPPKVLYGVHDGAIPGSGHPTNNGLDPYIATRGENGWSTSYVGVPANLPYSDESFASPLAGADASLDTFAFSGPGLCSPCFADGTTGIPVRLPDGSLVQGMTGSEQPGPSAVANMLVKKPVSADGTHLIFGSTSEFEEGAGSPAIYDRDLSTGITHAVSKGPGGGPIPCLMNCSSDGLAELDVSGDGSRIVVGQLVATDSAGNRYWHLYMNIGDSSKAIDLTPGAADGVIYGGMSADGTKVYFTTADQITGQDTDNSADLYRDDVTPSGANPSLVSVGGGGSGNSDSCEPLANSANPHWNTTGSTENCDVVAVGGGGGVAAGDGSVFFLSPELLDGTSEPQDGVANAPNLYISRPGSPPHFVATLESSLTGPTPALLKHPFQGTFAASPNPEFVAVDNSGGASDGDVYVVDGNQQSIRKYDSEGNPITSWGDNGELEETFGNEIAGIAVGPGGVLYVAIHEEFNSASDLFEFDENGAPIGEDNVEGAPQPIGIAVDSKGNVFYEGYYALIYRWNKSEGSSTISSWEYESGPKSGVAVDWTSGTLYVGFGGESIARYAFDDQGRVIKPDGSPCEHELSFGGCEATEEFGTGEVLNAGGMFVDPTYDQLYIDEGNKILRFYANGHPVVGPLTGAEVLSNSTAVAVSSAGNVYATNAGSEGANVAAFGPLVLAPDVRTDNPLVVDSVNDSGTRQTGDFEVSPSGDDAVFPSTVQFTGASNGGHEEIFRYDAPSDEIACISCNPTNAVAAGDASLARDGLSLTDDGRVFFDSNDPLVPSDLDNREDVYEWDNGRTSLISTGLSPFNSSLLSASADGTDAFFFTRDTLVRQDLNGSLVKVYDARENGGFPYSPPPVSCKASDECHGAGTQQPPPPTINTVTGSTGNSAEKKPGRHCKPGFVKRHGHCVKSHKRHHRRHRRHAKRGGRR